jgi:hypothetical protein
MTHGELNLYFFIFTVITYIFKLFTFPSLSPAPFHDSPPSRTPSLLCPLSYHPSFVPSHTILPFPLPCLILTPSDPFHSLLPSISDVNMERRKSLQGLVDLRMETIPLVESEEENAAQDQLGDNHKYLLFKNPSGKTSSLLCAVSLALSAPTTHYLTPPSHF